MILDPTTLFRANIAALTPYSTARDEFEGNLGVFLDANENPNENGYNRYPDPRQTELKKKLSKIKGIAPDQIFTGNGSDEAIDLCYRVFCRPGVVHRRKHAAAAVDDDLVGREVLGILAAAGEVEIGLDT